MQPGYLIWFLPDYLGKLILSQAKSWNLALVGQDGEAMLELAPHWPASQALLPRGVLAPLSGAGYQGR